MHLVTSPMKEHVPVNTRKNKNKNNNVAVVACLFFFFHFTDVVNGRDPTWDDFLDIEEIIDEQIEASTCPDEGPELWAHWDWPGGNATDCHFFPRVRNPRPLGSRIVRHAFHDAAGFMDGFVDLNNPENNGLQASTYILDDVYATRQLSTGEMINSVMHKADFYSWAAIAAVRILAGRQIETPELPQYIPVIPLRIGRMTYDPETNPNFPEEEFPLNGAASGAAELETYFFERFGFSTNQTVTLMGAHTLGGARRPESGYQGMWTQSKNKFNAEYYTNMMNPIPMQCNETTKEECHGIDTFVNLVEAGLCDSGAGDRCNGWEQVVIRNAAGDKFQWKHSCDANGDGCHHLMMNVDMALFRDIDAYICTASGHAAGDCEKGQIIGFPSHVNGEPTECQEGGRIYATCFEERSGTSSLIEEKAFNRNKWIDEFVVVFDLMMQRVNGTLVTLRDVAVPEQVEEIAEVGEDCPLDALGKIGCDYVETNPFSCHGCISGFCGISLSTGKYKCRAEGWTPSEESLLQNGSDCPSTCVQIGEQNPYECSDCASGYCGTWVKGNNIRRKCKPSGWSPADEVARKLRHAN